jgi:uncharacterized protein (TIGR03435 family)
MASTRSGASGPPNADVFLAVELAVVARTLFPAGFILVVVVLAIIFCVESRWTMVQDTRLAASRALVLAVPLVLLCMLLPHCVSTQQPPAKASMTDLAPAFEVASIKPSKPDDSNQNWDDSPGRVSIENYTLRRLIRVAYGLKSDAQIIGGPKWMDSERFDIVAKADDAETLALQKMDRKQLVHTRTLMLQSFLADRFHLQMTSGERNRPIYALVLARSGIRFAASAPGGGSHDLSVRDTAMTATGITMDSLADYLTSEPEAGDRVIENRTGLTGDYDFKLNWTRDRGNGIPPGAEYPGLSTALEEQLGLKLVPAKGQIAVVVVTSATEPALD